LVFQIVSLAVMFVFEMAFVGYFSPLSYGIPMVFLEAYKLYFLGGRYPPLGDLLDRSTPPQELTPPPANYLAYASDTPPPPTL